MSLMTGLANAVRSERQRNEMTLSKLAETAGVSKSTLSDLEAGNGNPSIETLWAIAGALGVPVSRLIEHEPIAVTVIRSNEGVANRADDAEYSATLLSPSPGGVARDVYRIDATPGRPHVSAAHPVGTIEHVVLVTGLAMVGPAEDPVELAPGDYITYPADGSHVFEPLEPTSAVMVVEQR